MAAGLLVAPLQAPAVALAGDPASITAGYAHTCAVTVSGSLSCWGDNAYGQLGDGSTTDRPTPVAVPGLSGVTQASAGFTRTCAVAAGIAKCWGAGQTTPVTVASGVAEVSVGGDHYCWRTTTGAVSCAGTNSHGQVVSLTGVASIAAGLQHTCAAFTNGTIACYGNGANGRLGTGGAGAGGTVSGISTAVQVTAGTRHSCARLSNGVARCWGDNTSGQLGDGTALSRSTPGTIPALVFTQLSAGDAHTCGVADGGAAYCWGENALGQLGDGTAGGFKTSPTPVAGPPGAILTSAGGLHTCAVSAANRAYCWGANTDGQIGDGGVAPIRTSPQRALIFSPPQQIAPAAGHSFATRDTQVFTVRAPNPDVAYKVRVTVRQGTTVFPTFEGAASAGTDAQATPPSPLVAGSYTWTAEWTEVDEATEWSPASASRNFTVRGNTRPSVPTLVSPATNRVWAPNEPQVFTVNATDPDLDNYTAYIEIRRSGVYETSMTTAPTPSGADATMPAPYTLQPDTYTWFARACDAGGCSADSPVRSFTVAAPAVNQAPERPAQDAPGPDAVFMANDRQNFSVTAHDHEGDVYHGRVTVTPLGGGTPRIFDLAPAQSDSSSAGEPNQRLIAGTYTWTARACQAGVQEKCGPSTTETRRFTVLANQAPSAPTHQSPSAGHVFGTRDPHLFAVTAADPDADPYRGVATVHHSQKPDVTFELSTTPSGGTSIGGPPSKLQPGVYSWSSRACDRHDNCGPASARQPFEVLGNLPPGLPRMDSPDGGHAFAAGDAQTFKVTASDPDLDSYIAQVEIVPEGSPSTPTTLESSSSLSGQTATLTADPAIEPGAYMWRTRACQAGQPEKCSGWTASRAFSVALPPVLNQSPLVPTLVMPEDGHMFWEGDPQTFSAQAVDPEGDDYVLRIRVRALDADSVPVEFVDNDLTTSGAVAQATPPSGFPRGAWRWEAAACAGDDPERCSPWSISRDFSVGGSQSNAPPAAVRILAPAPGEVFMAGERQDFSVRTTDPEGEAYSTEISFRRAMDNMPMRERVLTAPVASGLPSSGSLAFTPLPPGTYIMSVTPVDARGGRGPTTQQTVAVATDIASPCDGVVPQVIDGWIGETYLQLAHTTIDEVGYLCVRTSQGAQSLSGWLRAESGGAHEGGGPSTGTTSSCPDRGEDNVPFPLYEVGTGDPSNPANQLQLFLRRTGATLTLCAKVKAGGGQLVDTSVMIEAPPGADLADLSFIPEEPGSWAAPAPLAPPAGLPSSSCLEQEGVAPMRLMNASLQGRHIWLHTAADDGHQAVMCARVQGQQGETSGGAVVRVPDAAQNDAYSLTTGKHYEDDTSPCVVPELHMNGATVMRLSHTEATADRLGLCLYVGSDWEPVPDMPTAPFVSAWLLVNRDPGSPGAIVTTDP